MDRQSDYYGNLSAPGAIDDSLSRNRCCSICKSANRKLSGLLESDIGSKELRMLVRKYLGIKVKPSNANTHVCVECIEQLESFKWFDYQGRMNDAFLKRLPNKLLPGEEKYCRLCLTTNNRLQEIFVQDSLQPNNELCDLIKESISIEIEYQRDFTSNICKLCRTQLEKFVEFKRIAQQLQNTTLEKKKEAMEVSECNNSKIVEPLLEVQTNENVIKTKKPRRRRRTKAEMALARAQESLIKEQSLPKNKLRKETSAKDTALAAAERKNVYQILWMPDDERNFETIRDKKGRVRICMDGHTFYLYRMKSDGTSLWNCDYKSIHCCKFELIVSSNGKMATARGSAHRHGKEPVPIIQCPLGKGTLLHDDGTEESFWLLDVKRSNSHVVRQLIYQNYSFVLRACFSNGGKDTSLWACKQNQCTVTLDVSGVFETITVLKGTHTHAEITNLELREALKNSKVNKCGADVVTPFRDGKTDPETSTGLRTAPKVIAKMSTVNEKRNFILMEVREGVYKIRYRGHDFKFCLNRPDGTTLWKCIWDSIHNCKAVIVITNDGSYADNYGLMEHSHSPNMAMILQCEPKEYSVLNSAQGVLESVKLFARECKYFRSRTILFRCHLYNLYEVVNNESRWSCFRNDSHKQQCPASLIITGKMDSFLQKGIHCHMPLQKQDIKSMIQPGNVVLFSALKQWDSLQTVDTSEMETTDDVLDMLKQQLLKFPVGHGVIWDKTSSKENPFCFVKDLVRSKEVSYKFIYQQCRYAFASIDEYGISQWVCCQVLGNSSLMGACSARVTIEGVFQRVTTRGVHNHS
ncbi:uncharacterized protein LOC134212423 [Armigeres subalbatus]|uniref:uncharacterized protein LOC134212423 n=1 Tax=Armigeres subalbatus TaxID=124917 RepID=UPI002ED2F701